MTYQLDARTRDDLRRELRAAARRTAFPGDATGATSWAELLFADGGAGTRWRDDDEPSQALLEALLGRIANLVASGNRLPATALEWYLTQRLRIPRLPSQPDTAPVVVTGDPAALPVVVPAGTELKAGRTAAGGERRYATVDPVTVLGAAVARVWSRLAGPTDDHLLEWIDRDIPLIPFDADTMPRTRHELVIVSDVLRFEGGGLTVGLTFGAGVAADLDGLVWTYSTVDGEREATAAVAGNQIRVTMAGACQPAPLDDRTVPFLRAAFPDARFEPRWLSATLTGVDVAVISRDGLVPDGGSFNDGQLDLSKEFEPFGPVPKRGDSFYVYSEEAFAKNINHLDITLESLPETTTTVSPRDWFVDANPGYQDYLSQFIGADDDAYAILIGHSSTPNRAQLHWQRYADRLWTDFGDPTSRLTSISNDPTAPGGAFSEPADIGGQPRRAVRAFLSQGDFGWGTYQRNVARFAAQAARADGNPSASDLIPPAPPMLSRVTLGYTTAPVPAQDIILINGQSRESVPNGGGHPFSVPFPVPFPVPSPAAGGGSGAIGQLVLGVDIPTGALGSTLSLFVAVDSAAACGTVDGPVERTWEFLQGGAWRAATVADDTLGLRQSGVIRFLTPTNWDRGGPAVGSDELRWLRFRTNAPELVGTIHMIAADAVMAAHLSTADDPTTDPTPATPIGAGAIKGPRLPVAGVKKMTNPVPSTGGRGPEIDYLRRAPGRLRHRNRAGVAWDYEELVRSEFPEVAVVRCLPHHDADDDIVPGSVGLVVVPRSPERTPRPSVRLAERIRAGLAPRLPVHATVEILCPLYVEVGIDATIRLLPGRSAAELEPTLLARLESHLHPIGDSPGAKARFGRPLFPSSLIAFLEDQPEVDHVASFSLQGPHASAELVTVDPCRGLIASNGTTTLQLLEQL